MLALQLLSFGSGYQEPASGSAAIIATRRQFLDPSLKDATVGFRLVRDGQLKLNQAKP
jgi:hypothetical protein